jgi:hypothetical protein
MMPNFNNPGGSVDFGTQASQSGHSTSGGGSGFTFGGINNAASNPDYVKYALVGVLAYLVVKKL